MKEKKFLQKLRDERTLYALLFPTILYFILFKVLPIINMRLAFFQFRARGG